MVRRKAVALRMAVQIGGPNRLRFMDHVPQQAVSARQVPDARARLGVDSGRHELYQRLAVSADDPERRIPGSDDLARRVHDFLQDLIELVAREDRHAGRQQAFESLPYARRFELWGHGITRQNASWRLQ